jgi:hypothetical protein
MDNFRGRLAIKTCVLQDLISVNSGTPAEARGLFLPMASSRRGALSAEQDAGFEPHNSDASDAAAGALGSAVVPPTVRVLRAICLTPRTELSLTHCAIAARDPEVLSTFPFLAAATPLLEASTPEAQLRFEGAVAQVSGSPLIIRSAEDGAEDDTQRQPFSLPFAVASTRRNASGRPVLGLSGAWTTHADASGNTSPASDRASPETVQSYGAKSPMSPGRRGRLSGVLEVAATAPTPFSLPAMRLALPPTASVSSAVSAAQQRNKLLWCTSKLPPQSRLLDKSVTGFTFWSPYRLGKLLLMMPTPAACKGSITCLSWVTH